MELPSLEILLLLIATGFIAAFVDSVVGGGGLITVPALLAMGLPPQLVLGTNKLASTMSSLTSTASFLLSGKIEFKLVAKLFPLSFVGAILGTLCVNAIPSEFLKPLVVIMLIAVTIYTLMKKNWGAASTYKGLTTKKVILLIVAATGIGFYDGFFGPGTGSFLIFVFLLLGFDFVRASGNAKVLNFGSNLASFIAFAMLGSISYGYGIPMGLSMIVGALVGSRVAIKRGATYVKPLFIGITILLIGKQVWDLLIK
ncbi:sulfite exporter TauE/SafE family protein [Paenibacillus agilis]|uniref:Probable membrane transporter protein n=1 Tax=Paenibacillus agilis TaxID=3020863 RepID=A0A559IXN4_9BACL|nr:TSUP family transporter [Paenibacillus agilis]TVX92404.1 TSUP family transporter [Paenibacillus agilis]